MKHAITSCLILISFSFSPFSDLLSQDLDAGSQLVNLKYGYDVTYYFLDFELKFAGKTVEGVSEIHFSALQELKKIKVDLDRRLKVEKVEMGAESLSFKHKKNIITISPSTVINPGDEVQIKIHYKGRPQTAQDPPWLGGLVWAKDSKNNPWLGVACQTDGAQVWWPVKNDLRDEPDSFKIRITLPETGYTCISNGQLIDKKTEEQKEIFTWETHYPINVYNVTFYIGKYEQFALPYVNEEGEHKIDFFVLPENLDFAKKHFQQTTDMMKMMEELFGEYPWWKEGCRFLEAPYAGMEHQTAISIGTDFKNDKGYPFNSLIIHELAHEWWGNSLSVDDFSDVWLQEGFATYCEALYAERVMGKEGYLKYINRLKMRVRGMNPMNAPFELGSRGFDGDQYSKGAMILHTLRNVIKDDEMFFDILRTFYQENKYGITSNEEFVEVVNRKMKRDFSPFFEAYLTQTFPPFLFWDYRYDKKEDNYVLKLKWVDKKVSSFIPLEIFLNGKPTKLFLEPGLHTFTMASDTKVAFNEDETFFIPYHVKNLK